MKALLLKIKNAVEEMRDDVLVIYSEKGFDPFKKPVLMALPALLILYGAVYSPSSDKLAAKRIDHENLGAISVYYSDYKDMKSRKDELRRKLPLHKDKGEWLSYILTSTSKDHGITFDSLTAQEEQVAGPLVMVTRGASVTSTYKQIGLWLAEMENSKIFLKITELNMTRSRSRSDFVQVTIKLSTIFPRDEMPSEGQP